MKLYSRRCIIFVIVVQFFTLAAMQPAARAAMISTRTLIESVEPNDTRTQLSTILAREDVSQQLMNMGVESDMVRARLASLTEGELLQLQNHIDDLPAGGGALEVIGIVFLVLLILELVGVTNVFNKI